MTGAHEEAGPTGTHLHAPSPPVDRTAEYLGRDLHAEGIWPVSAHARYGTVVFDVSGRVLLREPKGHFGGFTWTFSKGGRHGDEHPVDTALRETLEETGHRPIVIGHLPTAFKGGSTSSVNFFYLAYDRDGHIDLESLMANGETVSLRRASLEEAAEFISQSKDTGGRARDLRTLEAAFGCYSLIQQSSQQGPSTA